ncbi:MAG TPA: NAD(P)H-hydrate epimerase [Candidatus Dormibacteraeota bacterium]|nr:NAD(P)H-hydrate epimerase [Candidatus Dormibacteraeota bacterium]
MTWPVVRWDQVRTISSIALRQADTEALTTLGIGPLQLMEVAGWQIARFVDAFMDGIRNKRVVVVGGSGNNGGDALVAARFLRQRGAVVSASIVPSRNPTSLAARHALTARRLGILIVDAPQGIDPSADVLIDGLFGTGIHLPLRDPAPAIIEAMNATDRPIVAIDVPSGMDADTGAGAEAAVRATATLTLAAPKAGLASASGGGRIFVADIGMPAALFGADQEALAALYAIGDIVELVAPRVDVGP